MNTRGRVLVIDEDPSAGARLAQTLASDYDVICVHDSSQALASARIEHVDLVLCLASMHAPDGFALCRRMKASTALADVPVILYEMAHETGAEVRAFAAGASDFVAAPIDADVLRARIGTHLALRQVRQRLRAQSARLEDMVAQRTAELEASHARLRTAMHNLRTIRVSTGVYWIQVPEAELYILCGAPADVVKHLMQRGLIATEHRDGMECETGPNVILLSDLLVQNGGLANLAEFPVLQMLYRQGMMVPGHPNNTGRKPLLIGSETQVNAQLEYIHRGNYGLVSEDELRAAGLDDDAVARHMTLKLAFAFGAIRPPEDLIETRVIGSEFTGIANGVEARRVGLNRYQFRYQGQSTEVNLNLGPDERYEAPYPAANLSIDRHDFGVVHLGPGDGWDPIRPSMGSVITFGDRIYLIDAGPNVRHTLQSLGIDLSEVDGIFHTHGHDDHFAGLPALIASGHRVRYYATPPVRHSVMRKLAALIGMDESLFNAFFDVHDLVEGTWNDCDGLAVMPVDSPHPVETTVFMFRAGEGAGERTYAHWADIASLDVMRNLLDGLSQRERLPADYVDQLRERYLTPVTLKVIDAGGGMIHGNALDFSSDRSERILLAHRATPFRAPELEVGSVATFGAVDALIPASRDYLRRRALQLLQQIFPDAGAPELDRIARGPIAKLHANSLMRRHGEPLRHAYLSLTGTLEERRVGSDVVRILPTGALIGAHSLYGGMRPDVLWRTASAARLLHIDFAQLHEFLAHGTRRDTLAELLSDAAFLEATWLFGDRVAFTVHSRLVHASRTLTVATGAEFVVEGGAQLCLVREGLIEVIDPRGRKQGILGGGDFFGEDACLGRSTSALWRYRARDAAELFCVPAAELRAIPIVLAKLLETSERRLRNAEFALGVNEPHWTPGQTNN